MNQKLIISGIIGFVVLIFILFFFPIVIIGTGQRGVVFNTVSGIEDRILGEGTHFRIPFVESVTSVSIQVQKNDIKAEAASKDLQTVSTDIVINWHLDASKVNRIYQSVGDEQAVVDRILTPAVQEVVKAAVAQKTAEEILTKRPELKADIDNRLRDRLATYSVLLNDVSITNVDFSKEFNAAIEAKQVAEQQAKQAEFTALKAQKDAEATVNKAKGDAEAQRLLQQSITPLLVQKELVEGLKSGQIKLPNTLVTGSNSLSSFILNLPQ